RRESSTPLQRQRPWIFPLRLVVSDDEAGGSVGRRNRRRRYTARKDREIARQAVEKIGMDQEAAGAVGIIAEPVDFALGARIDGNDRLAQRLSVDEVLRQLIERAVESGVEPRLPSVDADQDFPPIERIEGKAGTLADLNGLAPFRRDELIGHRCCFVENEMKQLEP